MNSCALAEYGSAEAMTRIARVERGDAEAIRCNEMLGHCAELEKRR